MPADNSLYNTYAANWWDENNFLHMLKTGVNPARFGYFREILDSRAAKPASLNVLDVGCGGGFLSEEFARLGCTVTGIDLSAASIATAMKHAQSGNLQVDYRVGSASALPFPDASFDIVVCCDVLEHLPSLDPAIAEAARVLKPGGLYLFDTINRTIKSYIETILVAQELPLTNFFAPGSHDWRQFISPDELAACLKNHHLSLCQVSGLQPGVTPSETVREIRQMKRGEINFAELGRRLKFQTGGSQHGLYVGYALKAA
jgi:2-polyprenyl-6-hydroxyphenyl methylase/3-demethylubiquinone-9 3-methyltransferase